MIGMIKLGMLVKIRGSVQSERGHKIKAIRSRAPVLPRVPFVLKISKGPGRNFDRHAFIHKRTPMYLCKH